VEELPETRYAKSSDGLQIGYQVLGEGRLDLLYFVGLGSHIDLQWDAPTLALYLRRLASFSRLILFDRRGTGVSDAAPHLASPTWEEWTEDVRAVLDTVESERAAVFAELDAGPIALLFAATQPQRVSSLVLGNTTARYLVADDYPIGVSAPVVRSLVEATEAAWGTTAGLRKVDRSLVGTDSADSQRMARTMRAAATPGAAAAQYRYIWTTLDVRHALSLIRVPTLVLHNTGHRLVPIEQGRYLAQHVDGARFVELRGLGVALDAADPQVLDEVAEFLTRARPFPEIDRVLTTVLFTDIVSSTERLASLGDQQWVAVLDAHDRLVRDALARFRGREIKTTGDGFHAVFDGPARAMRCAQAITAAVGSLGVHVRAGLHTGECEVRGDDVAGLAVHIAARVGPLAGPGEVLVTSTVKDLVAGSGVAFTDRGEHELKGVPGTWRLFSVEG
jgi:class 3 adenylate cyclase